MHLITQYGSTRKQKSLVLMSLGNYKAQSEFYDESEDVDDDDGFRGDSIDSMSR